jgi:4'-phosphopantetheinyl transferase
LNSLDEKIQWASRSDIPPLAGNEIHVWAITLAVTTDILKNFAAILSPAESERAKKFKFDKHRNRFIAGRGAMRVILGKYLDATPADIRFVCLANGKPDLVEGFEGAGLHFNLSHTEDLALLAVTRVGRIGVDVECVRPIKNVDELVARFFSPRENEIFQKVPDKDKPAAFFNLWTRKEALLKATGEGITKSLSLVEVSFLPGEAARLLSISGNAESAGRWWMRELSPAEGFTGAIALDIGTSNIEHRTLNIEGGTSNIQHPTSNIQLGKAEEKFNVRCWRWA